MKETICQYVRNAKDTQTFDCDEQEIMMLFKSVENSKDLFRLRTDTRPLTPQDKSRLKQHLPAICWSAVFADGKRHAESAQSTGLVCMDIDLHDIPKDRNPAEFSKQYYKELFAGREEELGIVFAHVSPSGAGLHVVYLVPDNCETPEDCFKWMHAQTSCDYDAACKDLGRMMYVSYPQDIIYNNL